MARHTPWPPERTSPRTLVVSVKRDDRGRKQATLSCGHEIPARTL